MMLIIPCSCRLVPYSWFLAFPVPDAKYSLFLNIPWSWWCLISLVFGVYSSLVLFSLTPLSLSLPLFRLFPSPPVLLAMALTFEPSSGWLVVWLAHKLVHKNQEHTHTHTITHTWFSFGSDRSMPIHICQCPVHQPVTQAKINYIPSIVALLFK